VADDTLKNISALIQERDGIDAEVQRIEGLKDRRKAINATLSQLMGLADAKRRGRKPKQTEMPI
jgi:hypothetical protein